MTTTINASTSSGLVNTADTSGILQLQTASTAALTIDASQNVGIGTATPNDTLEVAGANAFIRVNRTGNEPGISFRYSNSATNRGDIAVTSGGAMYFTAGGATERMRITAAGNVGIGTTTPSAPLDVTGVIKSSTYSQYGSSMYYGIGNALSGSYASTDLLMYNGANGIAGFITNNTERMRITSGGVLLLNETSTGSSPLMQISGDTSSYNNLTIKDTGTTYSTGNRFAMFTNSSNAVAGQIQHTGVTTTAFATSSDQRLKENIVDAPNALDKIMDIKVRSYDWKEDSSHVEYGFVAQEVNEVYGEPVGVGGEDVKDDPWNIEYGRLTPILLKAIQEQQALITDLTTRLSALEGAKL